MLAVSITRVRFDAHFDAHFSVGRFSACLPSHSRANYQQHSADKVIAMNPSFVQHVDAVPADLFAEAWNAAATIDEAASAIRAIADGPFPRWALSARAIRLRKERYSIKTHAVASPRFASQPTNV